MLRSMIDATGYDSALYCTAIMAQHTRIILHMFVKGKFKKGHARIALLPNKEHLGGGIHKGKRLLQRNTY